MKTAIVCLISLLFVVSASAESLFEGRVRLESGEPVADAQIAIFDMADLRQGAIARAMTDGTGYFALPLAALGGQALPEQFALGPNYPNPFNPTTIIPYQLPTTMHVRLEVFNILGQRLTTLVDGERAGGFHAVRWDATDAAGQAMAAGVYFYRLSGEGVQATRRMVLIDGQAGIPAAEQQVRMPMQASGLERVDTAASVYGLTVVGEGLVAYVNPAFRVGVDAADIVLEVPGRRPRMKLATGGILGDVTNDGQVNVSDALYVSLYIQNPSVVLPNNGDITLGDVNGDGAVNNDDISLLLRFIIDSSDPSLPSGIGKPVGSVTPPDDGVANKLYWADVGWSQIQRSNLDGSRVENLITTGLERPSGIALDVAGGKLYWTDVGTDKIQRSNLDGSGVEDLITTGLERPYSIVLDVAGGKLYWTDAGTDKIQRSNLDGSGVEDLITTGLVGPFGIALDLAGGKLYWADAGTATIQRSNLDGSGVEDLITTGLEDPFGIALDLAGGKMYWTDVGTDKIQRSNLDGSGVEDLITTGLGWPFGIALDLAGGKLYWADFDTDKIQRSNLDGSGVEDLITTGLEAPSGIALGFEENVPTRLTQHSADDRSPAWSPDGTQIAFMSNRDGNYEIYVMAADGSQPTRLTQHSADDWDPAWSPDGTQITFHSYRDDILLSGIYVMAADGSQPTRLTQHGGLDPAWSPDGTQIAFWSYRDVFLNSEIYVMAADGSQLRRLRSGYSPAWSPDGTQIAFQSDRDGNGEIYVMAADGSQPTRLTQHSATDWFPAWSPDGTQIAFESYRDGNGEIYVMAADGSQPTRLTQHSADDRSPAWSPDGTQIAFMSKRDGNPDIYVMAAKPETDGDGGGGDGDEYTPVDWIDVLSGGGVAIRIDNNHLEAYNCINMTNSTYNDVTLSVLYSKWQWRKEEGSEWTDVPGSRRTGALCGVPSSLNPKPGEYRVVAEIEVNGETGKYASKNKLVCCG